MFTVYCMPQSPAFLVTVLVMNLVTDTCIILIPIPIIMPLKIAWGRKIGIMFLFGAGIFVMIAAILRVYFVLSLQQGQTAAIWSCREDFVAIVISQATMIRPILTRQFWVQSSSRYSSDKHAYGYESHELSGRSAAKFGFRAVKDPYNVSALQTGGSESEERIIGEFQEPGCASRDSSCQDQRSRSSLTSVIEISVPTALQ